MIAFVLRTHPLPIDKTSRWLLKAQVPRPACRAQSRFVVGSATTLAAE